MHGNIGTMDVMDPTGHTTVTWNPDEPASVRDARAQFTELVRQGYSPFRMTTISENGIVVEEKSSVRMDTFDPRAGRVIMVPPLRGG